ncbi:aspartyl-tRNA(Asn)/glutamyl-tRNA(Gln) amidotransferase subunit A [Pseudokineococcus lusitanus]|uniref:Aspartyl-tRNA(Asn)/glutamyl-tRNA(Gln) amidotransferase subunit A n=2 Tax=Pseudokineococcus lusitanus TaxID=763993 RepID=A0A3N1G9Z7_9ACTN|nr:aspartyl-tRNA(Asn)/glutamyl-tRNA(Gln) amidotransferase subunit A [Pseudokineococcus lusitanus]
MSAGAGRGDHLTSVPPEEVGDVPGTTPAEEQRRGLARRSFLARSAAVAAMSAGAAAVAAQPAAAAPASGLRVPRGAAPTAVEDPTTLTLVEAALAMAAGTLSAVELVQAHLERVERLEGTYRAHNALLVEEALVAARRADRRRRSNPYGGLPITLKDNLFTAGVPTTANSTIFADFVPPYDSTVGARLVAAGGVVVGKGQMGPLATTRATTPAGVVTTVNAWTPADPSVSPGGSSSGPATAVAGRLALASLGTQTGGSITAPANAQGLTGLKPTMGRTSIRGIIPLSFTRDHVGPLAKDALDAAVVLQAMAGPDDGDARTLGLPAVPDLVRAATPVTSGRRAALRRRTRVGVPPDFLAVTGDELAARQALLTTLRGVRGLTLVDVTYPEDWDLQSGTFNVVRLPERTEPFRPWLQQDLTLFGVSVLSWLQGLLMSGDEWVTGQRAKHHFLAEVLGDLLGRQCDVVLQTSPVPFDVVGLPEIAFPIGLGSPRPDGTTLPLGTILGGAPYEEDRLLEVVAAYQSVTDWHRRRPADPVVPAAGARSLTATAAPEVRLDAIAAAEQTQ